MSASAPWVGQTLNGIACSGNGQGYGPFDYTQRHKLPPINLSLVEGAHFRPTDENHIEVHGRSIPGGLDYTLRAWPNHHRALLSAIRYQIKLNNKLIKEKLKPPAECYLQRAINFSPKDANSYSLYGYYLKKTGHLKQAKKRFKQALQLAPNNSKIEYSYSLLLIELKQYAEALDIAKKSYEHGKPPSGLRNKMIRMGIWK